jgi:thiaminase/transcriptional activator TenA
MARGKLSTARLLNSHRELWSLVVRNPFALGMREGSLPASSLDRWLVQSRLLGEGVFLLLTHSVQHAPSDHREFLIWCLKGINNTLLEFDRQIVKRGFDERPRPLPATRAFLDFTKSLAFEPYVCNALVIWAVFRAYAPVVSAERTAPRRTRQFLLRIRGPNTPGMEPRLRRMVDDLLARASAEEKTRAEEVFIRHLRLRIEFWATILAPG